MNRKPRHKHDLVFQLSLTELAFTIIFLLLILTGFMLSKAEEEKVRVVKDLADLKSSAEESAVDKEAVESVYSKIKAALMENNAQNPDDVISELKKSMGNEAANIRLQKEVEDLNEKVSSLERVSKAIKDVSPDNQKTAIEKMITDISKENKDMRGQVAWLQSKLSAGGGRDLPPCWAEEKTGKIQYLFNVEIHDSGLKISKSWPEERDADAKALRGIEGMLSSAPVPLNVFRERVKGIEADSKAKGCRHYVVLSNHVKQLDVFNRSRFTIEEYFYKYELR